MRLISTRALLGVEAGEPSKCYRRSTGVGLAFPICPRLPVEYGRVNLEVLELSGMNEIFSSTQGSRVGLCRRCPRPSYWYRLVEAGMSVG